MAHRSRASSGAPKLGHAGVGSSPGTTILGHVGTGTSPGIPA